VWGEGILDPHASIEIEQYVVIGAEQGREGHEHQTRRADYPTSATRERREDAESLFPKVA
jgi:hypothetical protein